jgi:hypothetical protein
MHKTRKLNKNIKTELQEMTASINININKINNTSKLKIKFNNKLSIKSF